MARDLGVVERVVCEGVAHCGEYSIMASVRCPEGRWRTPRFKQNRRRGHGQSHFDRRSEEHTSELQSLMRISYAVFCLKKKNKKASETTSHEVKSIEHTPTIVT